jgi:UDP-glucose 4-epimerase
VPRVVIFGNGFLGRAVAKDAISRGRSVTMFARSRKPLDNYYAGLGVEYEYSSNFAKSLRASRILHENTANIFFALGIASPHQFEFDLSRGPAHELNAQMYELAAELKSSSFFRAAFISSGGTVYGENPLANKESGVCAPISEYGKYNRSLETMLQETLGNTLTIFRLSNPYGEEQHHVSQQGLIAYLADAIGQSRPVNLFGFGEQIRDYVQVSDVARILNDVMGLDVLLGTVNVGTGVGTTNLKVASMVAETLDKPLRTNLLPPRSFDVETNTLDTSKLRAAGIYEPAPLTFETLRYLQGVGC